MDAVAFARLGYIIADLYKSVKREKCFSLKIGIVAKNCRISLYKMTETIQ